MIKSHETEKKVTPLMKQYWDVKNQHPDKIVFFRMGDFYELFYGDAQTAAPFLGITLTSRNKKDADSAPMCGFPHHSVANSVNKLLNHGFKVAICDQVEDPKLAKGIVKREVTKILTPGMVFDFDLLESFQSHYILAIDSSQAAFIETSTLESFSIAWKEWEDLLKIVNSFEISEFVFQPQRSFFPSDTQRDQLLAELKKRQVTISELPVPTSSAAETLTTPAAAVVAATEMLAPTTLIAYIKYVNPSWNEEKAIHFPVRYLHSKMKLNHQTVKQLELFDSFRGIKTTSLFGVLNQTQTALGARKLRDWLRFPLTGLDEIETRQQQVEFFVSKVHVTKKTRELLSSVYDIQRKLGKVSQAQCSIIDIQGLADSSLRCFEIVSVLEASGYFQTQYFQSRASVLESLRALEAVVRNICEHLADVFVENPPLNTKQGGLFKRGVFGDLDEWIDLSSNVQKLVHDLEAAERTATGINSLKVRYNQVFGFYIEITHAHSDKVPTHYKRKQTLTNAERFYTDELMELEKKVLLAQSRRAELESEYFEKCKKDILGLTSEFLQISEFASEIDVYTGLAWVAMENNYVRPQMSKTEKLNLVHCRHPVVEKNMTTRFVPNSIQMSAGQIWVLTGPNMAGKSTLMRQVALIQIMAQVGSFVPAESAVLPVMDAVYTRIGANDSLSEGLSTFMVEMKETAELLAEATSSSLILLDEIGRGTATYDGLSLAEAIIEYIAHTIKGYTLFATHYHEITALAKTFPQFIRNGHMEILQGSASDILFSYVFKEGSIGRSYGIQVAELAGLPESLIQRAKQTLSQKESQKESQKTMVRKAKDLENQLALFVEPQNVGPDYSGIVSRLKSLDLNTMSPLESLVFLSNLQKDVHGMDVKLK
ncbi:MAG: DNA mismatch repair protein MutS [Bdellovibrionaceae bacterium]|nr:DNA mismatch repair protein MutS [Pseudobdellovibrionaceae bacterium]